MEDRPDRFAIGREDAADRLVAKRVLQGIVGACALLMGLVGIVVGQMGPNPETLLWAFAAGAVPGAAVGLLVGWPVSLVVRRILTRRHERDAR
jgi:hypothetical protein